MSAPTVNVRARVYSAGGAPVEGAKVTAQLSGDVPYNGLIVPGADAMGVTDATGTCTLALFPNELGELPSRYTVTIARPGVRTRVLYAVVPNANVDLDDCLVSDGPAPQRLTAAVVQVNGQTGAVALTADEVPVSTGSTDTVGDVLAGLGTASALDEAEVQRTLTPGPNITISPTGVIDSLSGQGRAVKQVNASRALDATDHNAILECTASNIRLTINQNVLPAQFSCSVIPLGVTSVGPSGTALVNDTTATVARPAETNRMFDIVRRLSAPGTFVVSGTNATAAGSMTIAPALAGLEYARTSATEFRNLDWGPETWPETALGDAILKQDCNVSIPTMAAPPNGYPIFIYFHATGSTKNIDGNVLDFALRTPALAAGYAFFTPEFRHPVANKNQGTPHLDAGRFIQFVRSLHSALNLDRTRVYVACRSRGNLAMWQAFQADLADPYALSYAGRQSSLVTAVYSISGQSTYRSLQFGELYIVPQDRAAALVAEPDNPLCGSLLDSIATAPSVPQVVMIHEEAYANQQVSLATIQAADAGGKHWPDQGKTIREAMIAAGYTDRIVAWDAQDGANDTQIVEQYADMFEWMRMVDLGYSSVEAAAIARCRRKNAGLYYIDSAVTGVSVNQDATGGTPAVGAGIGGLVDGQYGLANRLLGLAAQGFLAGEGDAAKKPLRVQLANGKSAMQFDANDALFCQVPNDGTPSSWHYTTAGEEIANNVAFNASVVRVGDPEVANKTLGMFVIRGVGDLNAQDRKPIKHLARLITGQAAFTAF